MDNLELLSISQVAQRLDISRQRVHKLIANEQLRAIRLGRYLYIQASELECYLTSPPGKPYAPRSSDAGNSIDK